MNTNKLFSVESIINKLNSVLNTANKIIPVYENTKPYIKNALKIKERIQKFNINKYINKLKVVTTENKKNETKLVSFNSPTFFH